ncbi:MAG: alpha-amylase family glycosyl hydrolase [Acidimicrobiales bacterium]
MAEAGEAPWWHGAVVYQIYPRSFCLADPQGRRRRFARAGPTQPDPTRDGAGDLEGIRRHLDHIAGLGADAIWLSPIFTSPMADFGYDVADYCDIDPLFGDLDDFDRLLNDAHAHSLKVLLDWVPNHTSDQHPWFLEARSSRSSPKRDWYVWRESVGADRERPPNNWLRAFGSGPAWTFDTKTSQWYLHLFLPEQPDLNWANPEVVTAMEGILDFWLARGVDGFRIDVVHALGKDPLLPDVTGDEAAVPYSALNDHASTHEILRRLRLHLDSWPSQPVSVGEVFLIKTSKIAEYYGNGDELHLAFNFPAMFCPFDAGCFKRRLIEVEAFLTPRGAWPATVLSNHDRPRHRTRYGGSEQKARAAAFYLLGTKGTAFLYAGEELGLEDAPIPARSAADPGGRDGCRALLPWDETREHGWALEGAPGWLPFAPEAAVVNAAAQAAEPRSMLSLYRRLISARRSSRALAHGSLEILPGPEGFLAFRRLAGDDERIVAMSTAAEPLEWLPPTEAATGNSGCSYLVEVASGGEGALAREGEIFGGRLGPGEAVILRPCG